MSQSIVSPPHSGRLMQPTQGRFMAWLVNLLLRLLVKCRQGLRIDVAAQRRQVARINHSARNKVTGAIRKAVDCGGVAAEWLIPHTAGSQRVLLYIHGGAFIARSPDLHAAMVAPWCQALSARALMVDYRLAPEHPYPAALNDCEKAYQWLLDQGITPDNIVIAGDSAGGNLALATLLRLKAAGQPLPGCGVLLSPFLDLSLSGLSAVANSRRDPVFTLAFGVGIRGLYARPDELLKPEVSPLFGDFNGLPPLLIQVGSSEMLLDDARRAAAQAQAAGTRVELQVWADMPHVFQAIAQLPQAAEASRHILRFIDEQTGWQSNKLGR